MDGKAPILRSPTRFCGSNVRFSPMSENVLAVSTSQYFGIVGGGEALILVMGPGGVLKVTQSVSMPDSCFDVAFS